MEAKQCTIRKGSDEMSKIYKHSQLAGNVPIKDSSIVGRNKNLQLIVDSYTDNLVGYNKNYGRQTGTIWKGSDEMSKTYKQSQLAGNVALKDNTFVDSNKNLQFNNFPLVHGMYLLKNRF